jgi:RNA polymerase sigma factor (sigma-70 family)
MSLKSGEIQCLINGLKEGSPVAFGQFYGRYGSLIYHIALKITRDKMEAEDICHDVLLEIYEKADQYDPERGSIEAWIAVKARSRSLDRLRKKRHVLSEHPEQETLFMDLPPESVEERVFGSMDKEALMQAIELIPVSQRKAVYGMYFEAKTCRELAQKWQRPIGTVKSWVRCGLQNIKKQMNMFPELRE